MNRLVRELMRRNVIRVAGAYFVAGWLILQVVQAIETAARMPSWVDGFALALLVTALPIVLFIAWAFELTPEGMKRTSDVTVKDSETNQTGRTLNYAIIGLLIVVLGVILWRSLAPQNQNPPVIEASAPEIVETVSSHTSSPQAEELETVAPPERSIAVLPFLSMSSNEDDAYFADGLTEEILNSLAYVPDLLVTSRTSSFQFRGAELPSIPEIAGQLGVAHILEGSVRVNRSGDQARITAQLIRVSDDAHLWSQTYDRPLEDVFAIQEDIAESIADVLGVALDGQARERMTQAGTSSIEAFVAYQRGYEIFFDVHANGNTLTGLQPAFDLFMEAVAHDPDFADAHYLASDMYGHQLLSFRNPDVEPDLEAFDSIRQQYTDMLERALNATENPGARAIIELDLQYFSDDWTGISRFLDRLDVNDGCRLGAWLPELTFLSGPDEDLLAYQESRLQCNPLSEAAWSSAHTVYKGTNNLVRAREISQHLYSTFGEEGGRVRLLAADLLSLGEMADAYRMLDEYGVREQLGWFFDGHHQASQGDTTLLDSNYQGQTDEEILEGWDGGTFLDMTAIGRRDLTNIVAAELDARPAGHHTLVQMLVECHCGAPWDLEATPVFAARVEEAGFPWPPAGAGRYPENEAHN